jgi:hypothetical protein
VHPNRGGGIPAGFGTILYSIQTLPALCGGILYSIQTLLADCGDTLYSIQTLLAGCGDILYSIQGLLAGCGTILYSIQTLPVGCGTILYPVFFLDYAGMGRKKQDFSLPKHYFFLILLDKTILAACKACKLHKPYSLVHIL